MSRLSVQLDGVPAYLYRFQQGGYEDKRIFTCAHVEDLSDEEALGRIRAKLSELPEEIDFDEETDLFERALDLAGFAVIEGRWIPVSRASTPACEREYLEKALVQAETDARSRQLNVMRKAMR